MSSRSAIKVGVIADQTGPLSFVGIANATVARMVIGDINAEGGLLGRRLEFCLADSATDDAVAAEKAEKLVREDGVNVILGSICSSTRQAIKGPAVVEGKTLYIYPSSTRARSPTRSSPAPVRARAAGRSAHPVADGEDGWEEVYPSADYIWPHVLNERVKKAVVANGGEILGEEYHPLDHMDYAATVERITASGDDVVFNTILPSGLTPFFEGLYDSGFASRGGQLVCTYMDENFLNIMPAGHCQGRRLPRLLPGRRGSVQPEPPLAVRGALPRRGEVHGGGHAQASTADCGSGPPP